MYLFFTIKLWRYEKHRFINTKVYWFIVLFRLSFLVKFANTNVRFCKWVSISNATQHIPRLRTNWHKAWSHYSDVIMSVLSVSNHQRLDYLLNRLFRRRSKKTSKLRVTGLCEGGIHRWPVNSPQKEPVTRKMFPFEDIITVMLWYTSIHEANLVAVLIY